MTKDPLDELDDMQDARAPTLTVALAELALADLRSDAVKRDRAERQLAELLTETQAGADVLGRRRLLLEVEARTHERLYLARIPFLEAITSLIDRSPVLAAGWREARDAYERGAFALVRSASQAVTRRIQATIAQAARIGQPRDVVVSEIAEALGARRFDESGAAYIRSYADTVFRTSTASAYTAGRHRQAESENVRKVIGAWRYDATPDGDVRPNHLAADGFIAHLDDPVWNLMSPPNGFNCRCALTMVPRRQAIQAGAMSEGGLPIMRSSLPAGAFPDAGFKGRAVRPDRQVY